MIDPHPHPSTRSDGNLQPAILDALTRIGNLLQQLVDKNKSHMPPGMDEDRYRCTTCDLSWDTYEDANAHWLTGEHDRLIANADATR